MSRPPTSSLRPALSFRDVGHRVKPADCAQTLRVFACFVSLSFAGLVVLARSLNPIPSRTRPLNSSAPMILWLKPWESRSLPGLPRTRQFLFAISRPKNAASFRKRRFFVSARQPLLRWRSSGIIDNARDVEVHGLEGTYPSVSGRLVDRVRV